MKRLELLDDYATGLMPEALADVFEEEMFAAAAKGEDEDDRWYDRFQRLVHYVAESGVLIRGSTAEDIEDLRRGGLRVHFVEVGGSGSYAWPNAKDEVDLVAMRVGCDVRGFENVNADIANPDGTVLHTFRDCLPDPATGNLYALCAPRLATMCYGTKPRVTRITGIRAGQKEREEIAVFTTTPA